MDRDREVRLSVPRPAVDLAEEGAGLADPRVAHAGFRQLPRKSRPSGEFTMGHTTVAAVPAKPTQGHDGPHAARAMDTHALSRTRMELVGAVLLLRRP